ncbi:MAG: hypothetical protein GXP45_08465 [bacterium]|nr:hypothetical protein [bacterium]
MKLYIVLDGEYKSISEFYNFDNGNWEGDGGSSYNNNIDEFSINVSDTTPSEDEWLDTTITALDSNNDRIYNYDGRVRFEVQEKEGSHRYIASPSHYDLDKSYYDFTSNDNGRVTLDNLVKITTDVGEFRLKVYDDHEETVYNYINIDMDGGSSSSYGNIDNYEINSDDMTPVENQRLDISITALDNNDSRIYNYDGKVRFEVQEKEGSHRYTASSSHYDLDRNYYNFSSSNNGKITLDNLIRITTNTGTFRLKIYDDNDHNIYNYLELNMDGSSNADSIERFYLKAYPISPELNEWVDVTIKTKDSDNNIVEDYEGTVRFRVEKRNGSYRNISSSNDYSLDKTSINFDNYDNGTITLNNLIKLKTA